MNNKEFNKLFDFWRKKKLRGIEEIKPPKSKDCLCFAELEEHAKGSVDKLTVAKKQHLQSCSYCQKMIATFEKAVREEERVTIYERLIETSRNFADTIALPFKALPRITPALASALAVILIFIIFSNQPLELKNYSFEFAQPIIKTRGLTSTPAIVTAGSKFRINKIVTATDCYVYLFSIKKNKIDFLAWEKIAGKIENAFPKKGWLQDAGRLVLLLSKNPLKDISSAGEIIIKNYNKGEKPTLGALRKELERKDISFYSIKSP
ncbi:MAG: hypothetical protein M0R66_02750 [Candidatus Omnitrophica bacterium]|nr:hypothetical protein [Candidatus Omnitrophota bacterium]